MNINLNEANNIFLEDNIELKKNVTFIFGKNGTGKSTLSELIKNQMIDYDVRIFQGFDGMIDENKHLNGVILGEDDIKIDQQIGALNDEIITLNDSKNALLTTITQTDDNSDNYFTRYNEESKKIKDEERKLNTFYTQSAASIKNITNPRVSELNYNTKNFQAEIEKAKILNDEEVKQYEKILKSEPINAIIPPNITFEPVKKIQDINSIIQKSVKQKVVIARFENDIEKQKFAKEGFRLHKKGDVCAFCGHIIDESTFDELESCFSADEVKVFQDEIESNINTLIMEEKEIDEFVLEDKFYPDYISDAKEIINDFNELKISYKSFFKELREALTVKKGNLFSSSDKLNINLPIPMDSIIKRYIKLVDLNNADDLADKQVKAKNELRYNIIHELLLSFDYTTKLNQLSTERGVLETLNEELNRQKEKITGAGGIDEKIRSKQKQIYDLQAKTKSEETLVKNINKKLEFYVDFMLDYQDNPSGKGFYQIKDVKTGSIRNVTKLSTGEKNVIAFLYFIEKLKEIDNVNKGKPQFIIFDDPMNSNDDTMQYLIMTELLKIVNTCEEPNYLVLLTHNRHFYLNVKYRRGDKKTNYIRFVSNGTNTECKNIDSAEDFKTSYEELWSEVIFLYNSDSAAPEMLLNPLRRITETYINFNHVNDFYKDNIDAKKLFDVNSHSIDDLEADLTGISKSVIIDLARKCFYSNNAREHFDTFCKLSKNQ